MSNLNKQGIVILGGSGLVGHECKIYFTNKGFDVVTPDQDDFQIFQNEVKISSKIISKMEIYPILDAVHIDELSKTGHASNEETYIKLLALKLKRRDKDLSFIYLSSGAVYGDHQEMIRDSCPINPNSKHGYNKIAIERDVKQFFLKHKIYRLFFPYGERAKSERLLPSLIDKIKNGKAIKCNADGGPLISMVNVKDLAEILFEEINSDWVGIKNIAGGEKLRIVDIAYMIGVALGVEPIFEVNAYEASNCYAQEYDTRPWKKLELSIDKIVQSRSQDT